MAYKTGTVPFSAEDVFGSGSSNFSVPNLLRSRQVSNALGGISSPELPAPEFKSPAPEVPAPDTGDGKILGMNPLAFSSTAAGLAGAFAPTKYDKQGRIIPTWQGNVSKVLADMFRAQQMAKALQGGTGEGAGRNNMLISLLLGGGKQ